MTTATETKKDVHSIATNIVVGHLKRGIVPWLIPQNFVNHLQYRGLNVFLLAILGYRKNFFITPKQREESGCTPKKTQIGHPVFYWKWFHETEQTNEDRNKPHFRYYYVYNIEQCIGIKKSKYPSSAVPESPL